MGVAISFLRKRKASWFSANWVFRQLIEDVATQHYSDDSEMAAAFHRAEDYGTLAIESLTALEVTTDELLRSNGSKPLRRKPSRRVLRRMERIQDLPPRRQYFVLKALDALLSSSAK
jgi:hypothetical protein